MIAFLYCITNIITQKKYFGVSIDPDRRKSEHFSKSIKGSILVQRAIEKYGKENLIFEIILSGEDADMYLLEPKYIMENNTLSPNGYNIAEGGIGGKTGHASEETKKKMSIAHTGKSRQPHTEKTKERLSSLALGRKSSDKVRKKMSETRKGSGNAMFGKIHSDETKEKIRLTKIGKEGPKKGIPRSEETKRKISETKRLNKLAKQEVSNGFLL